MESEIFKKEAIQKTLLLIDEPPTNWKTFNDELHTYIIEDDFELKSLVRLNLNELPVLECVLEDSFMLITTDRIISRLYDNYGEMLLLDFVHVGNDHERDNFTKTDGKFPKTNIITIIDKNNNKLFLKIDSYHPAHFVKTLIINMSNYLRHGKWFWDPQNKA